jgi:hypothetical protein
METLAVGQELAVMAMEQLLMLNMLNPASLYAYA